MINAKISDPALDFQDLNERNETKFIVVHHSAISADFTAAQIHQSHLNLGYSGIGYHFFIKKSGEIERGRPIWAEGAHAFNYNHNSIGVCLSGNFEFETPNKYQIENAALLIANLCAEFNIPVNRQHILGHCELNNDTACPGKNLFDLLDDISGKANWYSN